jgi:FabA-like domain
VQAVCQLVQFYAIERGLARGMRRPRFTPVLLGSPVAWKYRGQVTASHRTITVEVEILETSEDVTGCRVVADGWLWADGIRIYQVRRLGIAIADADG